MIYTHKKFPELIKFITIREYCFHLRIQLEYGSIISVDYVGSTYRVFSNKGPSILGRVHFVMDSNEHKVEADFCIEGMLFTLLCATVVIAATRSHLGLFCCEYFGMHGIDCTVMGF